MGRRRTVPKGPSGMEIMRAKSDLQRKIDERVSSEVQKCDRTPMPVFHAPNTKKTEPILNEIFARIAKGETLTHICKEEGMPSSITFMQWIQYDDDVRERYYRAKEVQAEYFSEEILDIADDSTSDIMQGFDRKGKPIPMVNYENVKRSELRIKARQWLMERVRSGRFNEKVLVAQQEAQNPAIPNLSGATIQIVLPDNGRKVIDVGAE